MSQYDKALQQQAASTDGNSAQPKRPSVPGDIEHDIAASRARAKGLAQSPIGLATSAAMSEAETEDWGGSFDLMQLPILDANYDAFRRNHGDGDEDGSGATGAYRMLRTQTLTAMRERGGKFLGITSPRMGAGKSTTSIHLALACARSADKSVVLADFDFRRPSVAPYLQATSFRSSLDYFTEEAALMQCVSRNRAGNLLYFLTNQSSPLSAEYLAGDTMDTAMRTLVSQREDTLLIADLPPLIGCDDTHGILPKLDGIILVVAAGETGFREVEHAVKLLPKDKVIATVLNKSDPLPSGYDYYY